MGVSKGLVTRAVQTAGHVCMRGAAAPLYTFSNYVLPLQSHEQDLGSEETVCLSDILYSSLAVLGFVITVHRSKQKD